MSAGSSVGGVNPSSKGLSLLKAVTNGKTSSNPSIVVCSPRVVLIMPARPSDTVLVACASIFCNHELAINYALHREAHLPDSSIVWATASSALH